MGCNMKLEIFRNQLQLENSQTAGNSKIEAKVEDFKSMAHLPEVNEDSSDDSSSSNGLPQREMSILCDLSVESKRKQYPALKEPDISTIPIGTKKDVKKETTPEVGDEKLLSATPAPKQCNVTEQKECMKNGNADRKSSNSGERKTTESPKMAQKECKRNDNVIRRPSTAGECTITKDNKETSQPSAKEVNLSSGPALVLEQLKSEEIPHKPKLDEIFPNMVEESKMDIFSESACAHIATDKKAVVEECVKNASPVPVKKPKMEISEPTCKASPIPKAQPATTALKEPEVKKTSMANQSARKNSVKDLGDKHTPPKTPMTTRSETKQAKTENKTNIAASPVTSQKEEKVINEDPKAKKLKPSSCSRKQEDASVQERKVSKQRLTSVSKSPVDVRHKEPPKESMMAGGECFASVGGIDPEATSSTSVAAATARKATNAKPQSAGRETTTTRTAISKQLNKLRNNKSWKRKHMVIAGGIGIAMVCCYAYYKTKT